MAIKDPNTPTSNRKPLQQCVDIGVPVTIREEKLEEAAVVLRVLIAIGTYEAPLTSNPSVESLSHQLQECRNNVRELASYAREVVQHV